MLNRENSIHTLQNNVVQEHAGIKFQELPFMTKINLRGNPNDKKFLSSANEVLNTILPTRTNIYIKIDSLKYMLVLMNGSSLMKKGVTNKICSQN